MGIFCRPIPHIFFRRPLTAYLIFSLAHTLATLSLGLGPYQHVYFYRGPLPTHFYFCFPLDPIPEDLKWNSPKAISLDILGGKKRRVSSLFIGPLSGCQMEIP